MAKNISPKKQTTNSKSVSSNSKTPSSKKLVLFGTATLVLAAAFFTLVKFRVGFFAAFAADAAQNKYYGRCQFDATLWPESYMKKEDVKTKYPEPDFYTFKKGQKDKTGDNYIGSCVRALQAAINTINDKKVLAVDGNFGEKTEQAVIIMQKSLNADAEKDKEVETATDSTESATTATTTDVVTKTKFREDGVVDFMLMKKLDELQNEAAGKKQLKYIVAYEVWNKAEYVRNHPTVGNPDPTPIAPKDPNADDKNVKVTTLPSGALKCSDAKGGATVKGAVYRPSGKVLNMATVDISGPKIKVVKRGTTGYHVEKVITQNLPKGNQVKFDFIADTKTLGTFTYDIYVYAGTDSGFYGYCTVVVTVNAATPAVDKGGPIYGTTYVTYAKPNGGDAYKTSGAGVFFTICRDSRNNRVKTQVYNATSRPVSVQFKVQGSGKNYSETVKPYKSRGHDTDFYINAATPPATVTATISNLRFYNESSYVPLWTHQPNPINKTIKTDTIKFCK